MEMFSAKSSALTPRLIEGAIAGDIAAREQVARRALTISLRTASALLRDSAAAEDVAQDVAIDALGNLKKLRDPAAFDAWIHRISARRVGRVVRRQRVTRAADARLETEARLATDTPDLADAVAVRSLIWAEVDRLPFKQRVALVMRYVHDLSDEEIAAALNCREGTVHALLSRGRSRLRELPSLAPLADSRP